MHRTCCGKQRSVLGKVSIGLHKCLRDKVSELELKCERTGDFQNVLKLALLFGGRQPQNLSNLAFGFHCDASVWWESIGSCTNLKEDRLLLHEGSAKRAL